MQRQVLEIDAYDSAKDRDPLEAFLARCASDKDLPRCIVVLDRSNRDWLRNVGNAPAYLYAVHVGLLALILSMSEAAGSGALGASIPRSQVKSIFPTGRNF